MKLAKLLTIVDKPKHPQTALARTRRLIHESGASAHLLAFCWNTAPESDGVFAHAQGMDLKEAILNGRRTWLREEVTGVAEFEHAKLSVLWTKDIARSIQTILHKAPVDLVVKSIHQSRSLLHTPLDWELLRISTVPVLLTSTRRHRQSGAILAAVDVRNDDRAHQRLNRRVLDAAHTMAALEGGAVHVVTAIDLPSVLMDLDIVDKRKTKAKARALAEERLETLLEPYSVPRNHRYMPPGKVGQAVNHVARSLNADLLVVGTHAHRIKQLMGIGNSAQRIVTRATCDVLAVTP